LDYWKRAPIRFTIEGYIWDWEAFSNPVAQPVNEFVKTLKEAMEIVISSTPDDYKEGTVEKAMAFKQEIITEYTRLFKEES
jgi:hypothetical protein